MIDDRKIPELIKNGFIILDKWQGPTSRYVVNCIKNIFKLKRVGHSGTLDPNVSGVLLVTLENACKVIPALQNLDKEYVGVMHLHRDVDDEKLKASIRKFIGEILQKPPVRAAVSRRERKRKIHSIKILDRAGRDVCLRVECEAGTYIRKLFHDIGSEIGGAHMIELRRTRIGLFKEDRACRIQDIVDAYNSWKKRKQKVGSEEIRKFVLPLESAVEHLKKIYIKDSALRTIINGSPLFAGGILSIKENIEKGEMIAIFSSNGFLVALGRFNTLGKKIADIERVIVDKNFLKNLKISA